MRAALKLELCAGVKVLTLLQSKLDKFKERAGFTITNKSQPMTKTQASLPWSMEYKYSNPTMKCIMSWLEDENASLPPTWRNFFQILREPGMNLSDLADQIERHLTSSENHQSPVKPISEFTCTITIFKAYTCNGWIHVH